MREVGAFVSEGQRVVAFFLLLLLVLLFLGRLDSWLDYWLPFASLVSDEIVEVALVLLSEVVHLSFVLFVYDLASFVLGSDLHCLLLDELSVELAEIPDYWVYLWRFLVGIGSSHSLRLVNLSFYLCFWSWIVSWQKIVVLHLHFLLLPLSLLLYLLLLLLLQLQGTQIFSMSFLLLLLLELVCPHKRIVVGIVALVYFRRGCFFEWIGAIRTHLLVSLILFRDYFRL